MEKLSPKLRSTRNSQRIERSTKPNATTYSSYFILPSFLYLGKIDRFVHRKLFDAERFIDAELRGRGAVIEEHEPRAQQQHDTHCK